MELIFKKEFEPRIPAYFTIGNKYKFTFESGFEYSVTDDKREVWCLSKNVIFNHFTFGYDER